MRIMVTGSREWRDVEAVEKAIWTAVGDTLPWNATLIHGCATGADQIARSIALKIGMEVNDVWPKIAELGFTKAMHARNALMVNSDPDVVLAFPKGMSRGTRSTIRLAIDRGLSVVIEGEPE